MKTTRTSFWTAIAFLLFPSLIGAAQADKDVYFSVWKDPAYRDYARPVATYFGTMFNSGWARTVAIDRPFQWNVGMSAPFAIRMAEDKTFEVNGVTLPTLVGESREVTSPGAPINPIHGSASFLFGLLIPTLEGGINWYYTALDFRLMYLPTFSVSNDDYSVAWFGFGLRHDLGHYIAKPIPIDIALGWHATWWGLDYTARKTWFGDHSIDGFAQTASLLIGKRWKKYELFGEIGWESSQIEASGAVEKRYADDLTVAITRFPTEGKVEGRNGFKIGVGLSLHFGSTSGLGVQYGSQVGGWFRFFSVPGVKELSEGYRWRCEKKEGGEEGVVPDAPENSPKGDPSTDEESVF